MAGSEGKRRYRFGFSLSSSMRFFLFLEIFFSFSNGIKTLSSPFLFPFSTLPNVSRKKFNLKINKMKNILNSLASVQFVGEYWLLS